MSRPQSRISITPRIAAHIKQTEDKVVQMEQGSLLDREIARLDHFKTLQMQLTSTAMH